MFDIGFGELLLIAVVALVVLGPKRLPTAARLAGLWIRKARAQWNAVKAELENELADEELRRNLREASAAMHDGVQQANALHGELAQHTNMQALPKQSAPIEHESVPHESLPRESVPVETASIESASLEPVSIESVSIEPAVVASIASIDAAPASAPQPQADSAQLSLLDPDPAIAPTSAASPTTQPRSDG